MRAGRMDRKASFYTKVLTPDSTYGGNIESWPSVTITTWGEVRFAGGDMIISNEEKFYSGVVFLTIRYRDTITETMRVSINNIMYRITYIEELGRREGLRLTLNKIND